MRDFIKFNYNLDFEKIDIFEDGFYFECNNKIYLICEIFRDEEEFKNLVNLLIAKNVKYHLLVLNKDGNYISEFNGKKIVVLESVTDKYIITDYENTNVIVLAQNSWVMLWEERIFNYETKKKELLIPKDVKYFLDYYLGLTEAAIVNYNNVKGSGEEARFMLQHNKISFPITSFSFYNPVNYLLDYCVRDLAEYVKSKFFYDSITVDDVITIINKNSFTLAELNMFLVRLIYPSYFFNIVDDKEFESSSDLFNIIKKSSQYENFLKELIINLKNIMPVLVELPF